MVTRIGRRPPRNAPAFLFNPRQLIPHSRSINQSRLASSLLRAIPMASCSRNQSAEFRATVRGPSAAHPSHNSSNLDARHARQEHSSAPRRVRLPFRAFVTHDERTARPEEVIVRVVLCMVALLFASSMQGQSLAQETQQSAVSTSRSTGSVAGVLKDPSGAVISRARVVLSSSASSFDKVRISDRLGHFSFGSVPVGEYQLSVTAPGFARQILHSVTVVAGKELTEDLSPLTIMPADCLNSLTKYTPVEDNERRSRQGRACQDSFLVRIA